MESGTYHFKVGRIDCVAASDGEFIYGPPMFPLPAAALFSNAPVQDLAGVLRGHGIEADGWREWVTPYTCLLLRMDGRNILIDTGAGNLVPHTGKLTERLAQEGIAADEIHLVILTHGHPDHIGGNSDAAGTLRFPNAEWVMSKREWEFWMDGEAAKRLSGHAKELLVHVAHRNLSVLRDRIRLVAGEAEIVPGLRMMPAPGHTPGHVALRVSSAGESLLCLSDLVLHPAHVARPGWVAEFDMLPAEVASTRESLLERAAAEQTLVLAFHFPFPGLGRVSRGPDGMRWTPLA